MSPRAELALVQVGVSRLDLSYSSGIRPWEGGMTLGRVGVRGSSWEGLTAWIRKLGEPGAAQHLLPAGREGLGGARPSSGDSGAFLTCSLSEWLVGRPRVPCSDLNLQHRLASPFSSVPAFRLAFFGLCRLKPSLLCGLSLENFVARVRWTCPAVCLLQRQCRLPWERPFSPCHERGKVAEGALGNGFGQLEYQSRPSGGQPDGSGQSHL